MPESIPNLAAEIEALKRAYAALNQNDIDGFAEDFDPQIERILPLEYPMGGTYHGIEAVKAQTAKGRGMWAEGTCTPERFVVVGDTVIVHIRIHVRLKDKTEWINGEVGDLLTFRNGKVIHFRTFDEFHEALEWAGVSQGRSPTCE